MPSQKGLKRIFKIKFRTIHCQLIFHKKIFSVDIEHVTQLLSRPHQLFIFSQNFRTLNFLILNSVGLAEPFGRILDDGLYIEREKSREKIK